jgi:hypothetical protein
MWHALYGVEQGGKRIAFSVNENGRLVAHGLESGAGPVVVRYPRPTVAGLVGLAALAYIVALMVLVSCLSVRLLGWIRMQIHRGRALAANPAANEATVPSPFDDAEPDHFPVAGDSGRES